MADVQELARVHFAEHRVAHPVEAGGGPRLQLGALVFDQDRRELAGTVAFVKLGNLQFRVMRRLARRAGIIVERSDLIAAMYAEDPDREPETAEEILRLTVLELRRALTVLGGTVEIRTERGVGYSVEVR